MRSRSSFNREVYSIESSDLVDHEIISAVQEDINEIDGETIEFQPVQPKSE